MPCAFKIEPLEFYVRDSGCQFTEETDFHKVDGQDWCRFHMPVEDEHGAKTGKGKWGKEEIAAFNAAIFDFIATAKAKEKAKAKEMCADLTGVVFPGDISFDRFADPRSALPWISFYRVHFADHAGFAEAHFAGDAWFDGAHFADHAGFAGAHFAGDARFRGRVEKPMPPASGTDGGKGAGIGDSFNSVSFAGARFTNSEAHCDFSNRRFLTTADFSQAVFHSVPEFHGSVLHQDTIFRGTKFLNTQNPAAPAAYRTLKLAMEESRAWDEANMFYALERQSRRRQKDTPAPEKFFSWLYEQVSYYGTNFLRPLGCLLFVTIAAFLVYDAMLETHTAGLGQAYLPQARPALVFAMEQIVRPFAVWTVDYLKSAGGAPSDAAKAAKTLIENFPVCVRVVATLQSVLSLSLVALFLLALRRRFKMG